MNMKATPVYARARGGPITPRSVGYSYHNGATLGGNIPPPAPVQTFGGFASPSPGGHISGVATGNLWGTGTVPYSNTNIFAGSGMALQNPGQSTIPGVRPQPILSRARNGLFS